MKQIWHLVREVTINLMTNFIGLKIVFGEQCAFFFQWICTNLEFALQPINQKGFFYQHEESSREQLLQEK